MLIQAIGSAIAVGHVNGDRIADVIVGALGKNNSAGQVYVYHGRRGQPLSTTATRILTQPGLSGGPAEAGDRSGTTLDGKELNNDGFADLVIGAPGEDNSAGLAHVTFGSAVGFTSNVRFLQQGNAGIAGTREAGDRFGTGIAIGNFDGSGAAEIAISAPSESFGNIPGAGLVNIIPSNITATLFSLSAIASTGYPNGRQGSRCLCARAAGRSGSHSDCLVQRGRLTRIILVNLQPPRFVFRLLQAIA